MSVVASVRWRRRPMRIDDLDAVMAIEIGAYSHPWSRANFVDSLAAGYLAELAEDENGRTIGYLMAMPGYEETHLLNLTVHPALQRQGCGAHLLSELVVLARGRGDRMLWLEVRESNAVARRLYRRAGFVEVGVRRDYYPALRDLREDAVVMQRLLDAGDALD